MASMRYDALARIWALLWASVVGWALAFIALIIGFIWGAIDILLQLISGGEVFDDDAAGARWVSRTLSWNIDNYIYGFTGRGQFDWWP